MGLRLGVTGGEHRAAVLIGQNGGIEGADMAGDADDLLLIHADEGTQHRQRGSVLTDGQRRHGLAGHLPQTLAGDQCAAAQLVGQSVRQTHHEPAHDEGEVILRAAAADLLLDLRKGYHMDRQAAAPRHQLTGQLQHLFPCLLAGIGRRGEVDHLQLNAALGHHVAGHRGVDAAGEQAHRPAAHADGQAAGSGLGGGVDVGGILPHLHIHRQLRMVYIHLQVGIGLVELAAHPLAQLNRAHGEGLVGTLALHLEAAGRRQGLPQIRLGGGQNGLLLLGAGNGPCNGDDAEHLLAGGIGPGQIADLLRRLHIDGTLLGVDAELAEAGGTAADVAHKLHLKAAAIQALQDHLAQLAQNDLIHRCFSLYLQVIHNR